MNSRVDETHMAAWRGFITAHARIIDAIDAGLVTADCVPLHWYDVLIELQEAPDKRLRMTELARKVVLSKSGLTRLVDKLQAAGMLERIPTPDDKRGAYAVITTAGVAALRKAWPVYAQGIQAYFAQYLPDAEADVLSAAFGRMLAGVER